MKLKIKLSLVLLVCAAFIYSACKKSSSPASPAVAPKVVASQIAENLYVSLYGGIGFNAGNGLNTPDELAQKQHTESLSRNFSEDLFCGVAIDTTFKATTVTDGSNTATVSGSESITFNCSGGNIAGFTMKDNLNINESTAQLTGVFNINENLTVTAVDPTSDQSNISLNGSLGYSGSFSYLTGTKQSGKSSYSYTFNSVILDGQTDDIDSGSASFTTTGSGQTGTWNYTGTIKFLGSGKAIITINGTAYNVDLTNGVVS